MIDDPVAQDPFAEYRRYLKDSGYLKEEQDALQQEKLGPKPTVMQRVGAAVGRGVSEGVASMTDTLVEVGQGAINAADKALSKTGIAKAGSVKRFAWGDEAEYFSSAKVSEWNEASLQLRGFRDGFAKGTSWWESAVSGLSQFAVGMVPGAGAGAIASRARAATKASKFLLGAGKGAAADFAAFDPDEARLTDILQNGPAPIRHTLGTLMGAVAGREEDDSRLEGRFKQAAEGFIVGSAVEGIIATAKWVRGGKKGPKPSEVLAVESAAPDAQASPLPTPSASPPPTASVVPDAEAGGFRVEGVSLPEDVPTVYATEAEAQSVASVAEAIERRASVDRTIDDDTAKRIWAEYEAMENGAKDAKEVYEALRITILKYTGDDIAAAMENIVGAVAKITDPAKETITLGQVASQGTAAAQGGIDAIAARGAARRADDASRRADGFALKLLTYANADMAKHYANVLSQTPTNELAMREMTKFLNNTVKAWQEFRREGTALGQNLVSRKAKVDDLDRMLAMLDDADLPEGQDIVFQLKDDVQKAMVKDADDLSAAITDLTGEMLARDEPVQKPIMLSRAELMHMARSMSLYKEDPGRILAALLGERRIVNQAEKAARLEMRGTVNQSRFAVVNKANEMLDKVSVKMRDVGSMIEAYRVNAMLSGLPTTVLQTISSTMQAALEPAALIAGGVLQGDKRSIRFGVQLAAASTETFLTVLSMGRRNPEMWAHITDATKEAWRRGEGVLDSATTSDVSAYRASEWGPVAAAINAPSRLLTSVDEFNKQLHYATFVRAQAAMDHADLVKAGFAQPEELDEAIEAATKMAYNLEGTGQAANPFALDWSRRQTFTTPLSGNWKEAQDVIKASPWLRQVLPFFRTPVNIYSEAFQYAPALGLVSKRLREELNSLDPVVRAGALGKQAIGAGLMGTTFMMVGGGMMTGNGPSDPQLRKEWTDAGNKPYTIKLPGGVEFEYRRLEPLSTVMGIMADAAEVWGELEEAEAQDLDNLLLTMLGGVLSSAQSKSFLTTVADVFDALSEGGGNGLRTTTNLIGNYAGSFVPAFANNARKSFFDDEVKESYFDDARNIVDKVRQRIPGFSEGVEARRNLLGEKVVMRPTNFLQPMVLPFTARTTETDPVLQALVDAKIAVTPPKRTFGEAESEAYIDLADRGKWKRKDGKDQSPYDRMQELLASPEIGLRRQLEALTSNEEWKSTPRNIKEKLALGMIQRARDIAFKRTLVEYQDLAKASRMVKLYPLMDLD